MPAPLEVVPYWWVAQQPVVPIVPGVGLATVPVHVLAAFFFHASVYELAVGTVMTHTPAARPLSITRRAGSVMPV